MMMIQIDDMMIDHMCNDDQVAGGCRTQLIWQHDMTWHDDTDDIMIDNNVDQVAGGGRAQLIWQHPCAGQQSRGPGCRLCGLLHRSDVRSEFGVTSGHKSDLEHLAKDRQKYSLGFYILISQAVDWLASLAWTQVGHSSTAWVRLTSEIQHTRHWMFAIWKISSDWTEVMHNLWISFTLQDTGYVDGIIHI